MAHVGPRPGRRPLHVLRDQARHDHRCQKEVVVFFVADLLVLALLAVPFSRDPRG